MASSAGSYQIFIRVSAHRAARRLKGLQGQLAAIDSQVRGLPSGVMDAGENITAAGTRRMKARNTALRSYGTATASAAKGVSSLNKASGGLATKLEAINAATPGAVKTRQLKEYSAAMRSFGTAGARGAEGAAAFRAGTKGMDVRLERMAKALPETAVGMELLDHAMKGSAAGWRTVTTNLNNATPAMSAYAKATNAAAAAQERMNRASLGATKKQAVQDKPAAAVTRTGNVVRRSTAVQNDAATASAAMTTTVRQNYTELAESARGLAASTGSLTAFGHNARTASSGVDILAKANTRLATSITAIATAQKKLNTAYSGAVAQPRAAVAPKTERVGNTTRAAKATAARAAVPNVDVQAMYGNLEGVGRIAATAEPQIDRLATSMERYAAAARLASNSTRTLAKHLGSVRAVAPGAAGAMNVATEGAAKAALAAAGGAVGGVTAASSEAAREIDKADKAMQGWTGTARTHGATMNWAGRQISMFFTLPLALMGGAAIKWQMDAEKAMTQVAKVYDGNIEDIKNSAQSIEDGGPHFQGSKLDRFFTALSSRMGKNKAEIADIAADWAAIGLQDAQLAAATKLTTEVMILGDMEAAEATRTLVALQAQYGLSIGDLTQEMEAQRAVSDGLATSQQERIASTESLVDAISTLNAVENATGATMPDLVRGFERTATSARQMGIDVQGVASHMATLVPAIGTAERAGMALKTIYSSLGAPSTARQVAAMENMALNAGLASDAFMDAEFRSLGLGKGIEKMAEAYVQLQGAQRFEWARDVAGVHHFPRLVQLMEDVSRGMGYQVDDQAEFMRNLAYEFDGLVDPAAQAAFMMDQFGISASDMSEEAQEAREGIKSLLEEAKKAESHSFYREAGGTGDTDMAMGTEDKLKLYERELNAVLESNPQKFSIAMQVIRNGLADFIVPILPIIIAMTMQVAKLANWLGNLPPAAQKFIAMAILTIAAFGPLIALFGTFFIATAMLGKSFDKLRGFLGLFRKDANGTMAVVSKFSKAIGGLRKGGGMLLGGLGLGKGAKGAAAAIGGSSAWPRDPRMKAGADALDKLGDESRDLSRKAGPASRSLDLFTGAVMRNLAATRQAAGIALAPVGGAGKGDDGKDKQGKKRGGVDAGFTAGAAAGAFGLPGLGKLFGRKGAAKGVVDDAKKTQEAAAKVEKSGMMARLGQMLRFNKDTSSTAKKGGGGIVRSLMRPLMGLGKLILKPFGLIGKALAGLVSLLGGPIVAAIAAAFGAVIGLMHAGGMSISDYFKSIFGNVGDIVREAMGDGDIPLLARPFVAAGEVIADVVGRLPEIVGNAFIAIYNGIKVVARKIWEVISTALNPFKRHSPSLVDNVTKGMSIIGGRFAEAGRRIGQVMTRARTDVKAFGEITSGLSMNVENIRVAENREKIQTHAPEAVPLFDSLVGHQRDLVASIDSLTPHIKAQEEAVAAAQRVVDGYDKTIEKMSRSVEMAERGLDRMNKRLDEAKKNFDRYSNAQIAGLGAVDDAIFENEMAQKRLQLALKKAGADDMATTEDALSRIQGQMDDMAAKRESLRLGGAGSEILDVYDQQLRALEGQRTDKMTGPTTEIERLNKALEDLQKTAETMDLERSLKFDPLNRQLDKMRNKVEEMSFERITSGMALHGAQVDAYQAQVDAASAAIDRQRDAITAVEDQRYLANMALDAEQEKLDSLIAAQEAMKEVLDEVSEALDLVLQDADAMAESLDKVKGAADGAAEAMDGFGEAADFDIPGGSFDVNEMLPSVEEMTQSLNDTLRELMEGINWGDLLPDINWGAIWDWVLKALKDAFPSAAYLTGYFIGLALRLIGGFVMAVGKVLSLPSKLGGMILQWVKDTLADIDWENIGWEDVLNLGEEIVRGIFTGAKNFLLNAKDWFSEYIIDPFINGLKKGLGIQSPATSMFPVGADIIAGVFEGIRQKIETAASWFGSLPEMIRGALGNLWEVGKTKGAELWQGIQENAPIVAERARTFGSETKTKIEEGLGNLLDTGATWVGGLIGGAQERWPEETEKIRVLGGTAKTKIEEGLGSLRETGTTWAQGLADTFAEKFPEDAKMLSTYGNFFRDSFDEGLGSLWGAGLRWIGTLWSAVEERWPEQTAQAKAFGTDVYDKAREGLGTLLGPAKEWLGGLWGAIEERWPEQAAQARAFGADIYNKIKEGLGDLWQLGQDTAEGLLRGIESKASELRNRIKSWASRAVDAVREGVDSHSPSRATMAVGNDTAEGFILGLEAREADVLAAAARMAAAAIPEAAPIMAAAAQAAPAAPAPSAAPAGEGAESSPFQAIAMDAQAGLGEVAAIAQTAADTTAAGYLGAMSGMRMADLASQVNHASLYTANATNLTTTAVAQATAMAAGTITQAGVMATGVTSASANMATGVLSASASMEAGMNASMSRMSSNVSGIINGQIAPVIGSIDPMLTTMTGWFDASVNNVGSIWAGIGPRTADPARFVINEVYNNGLRNAWNAFNEFLGIGALPERVAHFSTGGFVSGPGGDTSDKIPAMLSNNEYVLRAAAVKKIGVGTLDALNAGAFSIAPNTIRSRSDVNEMLSDKTIQNISAKFAAGGIVKGDDTWKRFKRAHDFGRRWHGAPYVWGGSLGSHGGTDCSGWQSSVADVIHGGSGLQRQWYTGSFPGGGGSQGATGPQGFVAGLGGGMSVGVSGVHTAGTISGIPGLPPINLESGGAHNYTAFGPPSVGADHGQFPSRYHLAIGGLGRFISAGGGGGSMDWGAYVADTFKSSFADIKDPGFPGIVGQWVPKSIEKAQTAEPFLLKKLEEMVAYTGTIDESAGAVERWRPMMKAALVRQGLAHWANDKAIVDRFMKQIWTESKGNPTVTQGIQDINSGGNEAEGLAQIAKGTWAQYRDPTLPDDWHDPWANLNAMARYVHGRYGATGYLSIGNGIGYDQGGVLAPTPGGFGTYYNHTGKPEAVLTNAQWRAIYRAASITPAHLAGIAAEAASAAVEKVTADDAPWKAAILGEVEAIATAASEPPPDPWEGFNSFLNSVNDIAQKAGSIGQAIIAAQDATAEALAAADERILEAANAAAEAASAESDKVAEETTKVAAEVAAVGEDTAVIAESVEGVTEAVEEVARVEAETPELFTEALERLWGEANDLYLAAVGEATSTIDQAINSGDLEGGIASLEAQMARQGAEANRIAQETLTLLGANLDTVAAVVGAWKPVVDGIYELTKAIPSAELRNSPWMHYPGGPSTFMEKTDSVLDGIWNVGAATFNIIKDVLPSLIKNTVGIGSGILNFVAENGDAVAAIGVALATGNVAAVLPFIPKILGAALELLPMIIQAIQEIVPALIKGVMDFIDSIFNFGNRAFSYDSMDDAIRAVNENTDAIRAGTFAPGSESGTLERDQGGSMVVFNGDLSFPGITNENDAKGFLSGVQSLSGRG